MNAAERKAFLKEVQTCVTAAKRAFCLTLYYTGCRISEALELTGERIDHAEGFIVFRTLKRRNAEHFRVVPVPKPLTALLNEIARSHAPTARLWAISRTTGYRHVKEHMKLANLENINACPKGLRHGFAIICVTQGVPVTTIQRWMGHARLETTAIYLELMGEDDRQQAAKIWE